MAKKNEIEKYIYSGNYDELRKKTARKPVIPLQYEYRHKGVFDEFIIDKDTETCYVVDEEYNLIPLGKNVEVIEKHCLITEDVTEVPIGTNLHEGDSLIVTQNSMRLVEGIHYTKGSMSIKAVEGYEWNGDLEEILFTFLIIRNQQKEIIGTTDPIGVPDGKVGTVLIRTEKGVAWADYDLTDTQYTDMVARVFGQEYVDLSQTERYVSEEEDMPEDFPKKYITGQVLVRTANGVGWMDVDITERTYEDMVANSFGSKYVIQLDGPLVFTQVESVPMPANIPTDGEEGDLLYKTKDWCRWGTSDLDYMQYIKMISTTIGDQYLF